MKFKHVSVAASSLLFVCGSSGFLRSQSSTPEPVPSLTFEATTLDLGKLDDNASKTLGFVFKNAGDADVVIKQVKSTCGCVVPELAQKHILPGESGEIQVTYNPANRQGKDQKTISVEIEKPRSEKIDLCLKAEVIPRVGIYPRALFVGEFKRGEKSPPKTFDVVTLAPIQVESVSAAHPDFTCTEIERTDTTVEGRPAFKRRFEARFHGHPDVANLRAYVAIKTNDATIPVLQVPLVANVVGELRIVPDQLFLRLQEEGAPFSQHIVISHRGSKPFQISDTKVSGPEDMKLEIEQEPLAKGPPGAIRITLRGITPARTPRTGNVIKGEIRLATDLENQREVIVPINGHVVLSSKEGS